MEVLRLSEAVHSSRRLDLRGLADPAGQVAPRNPSYVFVEKRHQLKPDQTRVGRLLPDCVVSYASHQTRNDGRSTEVTAGYGGIVEIDETFVGGKVANNMHRNTTVAAGRKTIVMTLVDREGDAVGVVVPNRRKETLEAIAKPIVDRSATIMTDGNPSYANLDVFSRPPRSRPQQAIRSRADNPHQFCGKLSQSAETWFDRSVPPRQR